MRAPARAAGRGNAGRGNNAAALLIRRGERAWAAEMLRPLAADPHDAALAAAARQLIEQAGGGTGTAATEGGE